MKSGVQSKVPVPSPLFTKVAPAGSDDVDRLGIVLSGSLAVIPKLRLVPSVADLAPMAIRTGAWLPTSITLIETISESLAAPSEAKKVILYSPACTKVGVQSKEPVPSPLSVKLAPAGSAEVVRLGSKPSGSEAEIPKLRLTPSSVTFDPIGSNTGV